MNKGILNLTAITAVALATIVPSSASAQHSPFSVEVRGGLNMPGGEFSDQGPIQADSDVGLGADAIVALSEAFGLYGGIAWDRFNCDGCVDGSRISTNSLEGGLEARIPVAPTIAPWVRGGVVWGSAEIEQDLIEFESDRSLGFQVAAGLDFPLGRVISVRPGVRYQQFDADFDPGTDGGLQFSRQVSFWSVDVAARIRFPR